MHDGIVDQIEQDRSRGLVGPHGADNGDEPSPVDGLYGRLELLGDNSRRGLEGVQRRHGVIDALRQFLESRLGCLLGVGWAL